MASPGNLVKVIAQVLGVPESIVIQHDRSLLSVGRRSKGGRGRSAAKVTEIDAASLLIPVVVGSLIKDAAQTWEDYASLRSAAPAPWQAPVGPLQELPTPHTFLDALTALVRAAKEGSLQEYLALERHPPGQPDWPPYAGLSVEFIASPFPMAWIEFEIVPDREGKFYSPVSANPQELSQAARDITKRFGTGDLTSVRSFTHKTVIAVGEFLRT